MEKPSIYLAGPIKGLRFGEATNWRIRAAAYFNEKGITPLSPMRYKTDLLKQFETAMLPDSSANEHPLLSDVGVTSRDRFDVMRAHMILMNFQDATEKSIGSIIEIGWADMLRKPIITVMAEGNPHWHGMIRNCSNFIVKTLDEALEIAAAVLLPE